MLPSEFSEFADDLLARLDLETSGPITAGTRLSDELGFDSLTMAEMLSCLADSGVVLPDALVGELSTIGDVHHYYLALRP